MYRKCTQPTNTPVVTLPATSALRGAKELICRLARRRHSDCIAHCQRAATPRDLPRATQLAQPLCTSLRALLHPASRHHLKHSNLVSPSRVLVFRPLAL